MRRARPKPEPSGSLTSRIARSHAPVAPEPASAAAIVCAHCTSRLLFLEPLGQRPAERRVVFDEEHARHHRAPGSSSTTREAGARPRGRTKRRIAAACGARAGARRTGRRPCRSSRSAARTAGRAGRTIGRRAAAVVDAVMRTTPASVLRHLDVHFARAAVDDRVLQQVAKHRCRTARVGEHLGRRRSRAPRAPASPAASRSIDRRERRCGSRSRRPSGCATKSEFSS